MKTRNLVLTGVMAALLAVCAWISIPTTVPFTLQTMGVFLAVGLLGGKLGSLAVGVYLLLGAVGLPVFSHFTGGIGALASTTGGYLLGFLLIALVMWAAEALLGKGPLVYLGSAVVGLAVCYLFGSVWFLYLYSAGGASADMLTVLGWCVFPFIVPDLIKLALAFALARRLAPALSRQRA
ncbi:biotin transporter BioY [Pseudoflavonifractor sp. CLA-AP-H29]|uniref:Biotin transporter n=1 Tax=Pseudoflavonifractor intestinihominis TaxID=3133171 RepID=A0ABV1E447_9FIRM